MVKFLMILFLRIWEKGNIKKEKKKGDNIPLLKLLFTFPGG